MPGPERTRSQLTVRTSFEGIPSSSTCSRLRGQSQRGRLRRQTDDGGSRPNKAGHAKPCAGRDDGAISFRVFQALAECHEVLRFEGIDAIRVGFQIVEQSTESSLSCDASSRESIVQGRFEILLFTAPNWPGHAETGAVHGNSLGADELHQDFRTPACSWLSYVFCTAQSSRLPSVWYAASRVRVPPISPTRITVRSSSTGGRLTPARNQTRQDPTSQKHS